jgi:hypothetical protein
MYFDGTQYVKITVHIHAPNPGETVSVGLKSKITDSAGMWIYSNKIIFSYFFNLFSISGSSVGVPTAI